uniref:ATP synthase F0 subunit 8 n=1 Tax=Calliostoma zizyphinum TaxID=155530 RepID=A0A2P0VPL5_9VEST|nr:ATP synthase F0 subunit 8 [Calliostoma zizyphinum]
MPQLAPVNWLFLFLLFWFIIALSSTLIWWSFKAEYSLTTASMPTSFSRPARSSWLW